MRNRDTLIAIMLAIEDLAEKRAKKSRNKEQEIYSILEELQEALDCPLPPRSRTKEEIEEVIGEMFDRVWFNRHMCHHIHETGKAWHDNGIGCEAAKKLQKKYPDIGQHDDFEYGMINGKLSALRWVLGDEMDFLDT